MKKSRIILPAAALLALSSAAAITGTVAWFTANRIRSIDFTGITAVNPEQGLILENVTNVANTSVTGDATEGFHIAHSLLRDASYDIEEGKLYKSVLNSDTGAVTGFAEHTNLTVADTKKYNNQSVFFATQFTMDFKVTRVDNQYNQCLMFDVANSSVSAGSASSSVINSLRIGFRVGTDGEWLVWAPKTSLTEANVQHVSGTAADAIEATGANYVVKSGDALPDDTTPIAKATMDGDKLYLGVLSDTTATTVTVTTWFEGTDPDCENDAADVNDLEHPFTADLQFSMRKALAE